MISLFLGFFALAAVVLFVLVVPTLLVLAVSRLAWVIAADHLEDDPR